MPQNSTFVCSVLRMAVNYVISFVPNCSAGLRFVGSYSECSLVFFGLATLNLRVDSCMFEMRFPMLAEGSTLGISFVFFLESLCVKACFSLFFLDFSLKQSVFQRTMVCHIGFVLL